MTTAKRKKYRRRKRIIMAYILRTVVLLVLLVLLCLVICGGIFIYDIFRAHSPADIEQEWTDGTQAAAFVANARIILDAGHGGEDCGTYSGEILEKDINLAVVLKMKELLEQEGIGVLLTREDDTYLTLEERTRLANEQDAELFVSIHCNYYEKDTAVRGLECYYYEESQIGREYAQELINTLEEIGKITIRNAKKDSFYVLKNTKTPAVLVELGYLSNRDECKRLTEEDYQRELAEEMTKGIIDILNGASAI